MRTLILAAVCLLIITQAAHAQTVTIEINAGLLENSTGKIPEPNGGLLQLIASPSGTFTAPTSSSYVTGDNVLVQSFAANSNGGQAGYTSFDFTNLSTTAAGISSGEALLLRFYPTLTLTGMPATPGTSSTSYGQVRSSTLEPGITDGSQAAWFVPAAGSTVNLDYVTISAGQGGTYSNASAYAVPEPSTYVMFVGGFLCWLGFWVRSRRVDWSAACAM